MENNKKTNEQTKENNGRPKKTMEKTKNEQEKQWKAINTQRKTQRNKNKEKQIRSHVNGRCFNSR